MSTVDQPSTESLLCAAENRTRTVLSGVVELQNGLFMVSPCSSVLQSTDNASHIAVAYEDTFEPCLKSPCEFPLLPIPHMDMYVC